MKRAALPLKPSGRTVSCLSVFPSRAEARVQPAQPWGVPHVLRALGLDATWAPPHRLQNLRRALVSDTEQKKKPVPAKLSEEDLRRIDEEAARWQAAVWSGTAEVEKITAEDLQIRLR